MIGYKRSEKNFLIGRIRCNLDAPNANAAKSVAETLSKFYQPLSFISVLRQLFKPLPAGQHF